MPFPPVSRFTVGHRSLFFPEDYSRNVRNVDYARMRNPSGINPDHRGNTEGMSEKPATESTVAQGNTECEDLSFVDQNCKFSPFSFFSQPPGIAPGMATFLSEIPGIIIPGGENNRQKQREKALKPGYNGLCFSGVKRRLRTLRGLFAPKQ